MWWHVTNSLVLLTALRPQNMSQDCVSQEFNYWTKNSRPTRNATFSQEKLNRAVQGLQHFRGVNGILHVTSVGVVKVILILHFDRNTFNTNRPQFSVSCIIQTVSLVGAVNEKTVKPFYTDIYISLQTNAHQKVVLMIFIISNTKQTGTKTFRLQEKLFTLKTVPVALSFQRTKHNLNWLSSPYFTIHRKSHFDLCYGR